MKFLYIVDHFVPFPQSEYGGIWNVIAGTEEECFDLIVAEDQDNFLEYYGKLRVTYPNQINIRWKAMQNQRLSPHS